MEEEASREVKGDEALLREVLGRGGGAGERRWQRYNLKLSLYQLETHAICISRNASQERRMGRGDPGEERRGRTREVSAPLTTSSSQLPPHQGQTRLEG